MKRIFLYILAIFIFSINTSYARENFYRVLNNGTRSFSPYLDKAFKYNYNTGPYIGADYLRTNVEILQYIDDDDGVQYSLDGGKAVVGLRIAQAFSLEAFYSQTDKFDTTLNFNPVRSEITGYGIDGIIYTPIAVERVYLVTCLGWGRYKGTTEKEDGVKVAQREADAFRYGLGIEYNFNEYMAIRGMYNVVSIEKWDDFDRFDEYQIGFRLYF